jgi:hypothetical protein
MAFQAPDRQHVAIRRHGWPAGRRCTRFECEKHRRSEPCVRVGRPAADTDPTAAIAKRRSGCAVGNVLESSSRERTARPVDDPGRGQLAARRQPARRASCTSTSFPKGQCTRSEPLCRASPQNSD